MTAAFNAGTIPPEEFHVRTMPPQFLERILQERYGASSMNAAWVGYRTRFQTPVDSERRASDVNE